MIQTLNYKDDGIIKSSSGMIPHDVYKTILDNVPLLCVDLVIVRENKVFLVANGSIKLANKKFTSIKNDYCLNFDQNADIKE